MSLSDIASEAALHSVVAPLDHHPSTQVARETLDMLMMQVACLKEDIARRDKRITELENQVAVFADRLRNMKISPEEVQAQAGYWENIKPEAFRILEFLADRENIVCPSIDEFLKVFGINYKAFMAHFCVLRALGLVEGSLTTQVMLSKKHDPWIRITPEGRIFLLSNEYN